MGIADEPEKWRLYDEPTATLLGSPGHGEESRGVSPSVSFLIGLLLGIYIGGAIVTNVVVGKREDLHAALLALHALVCGGARRAVARSVSGV